jgi:hypothetical protein
MKNWKFKSGANTKECGDNNCNNYKCKFYSHLKTGCDVSKNFRNCEMYHVRVEHSKI